MKSFPCIFHDEVSKLTQAAPLIYIDNASKDFFSATNKENVEVAEKIVFCWMRGLNCLVTPLISGSLCQLQEAHAKFFQKKIDEQIHEIFDISSSTLLSMNVIPRFGKWVENSLKQLMDCNLSKGIGKIENSVIVKLSAENTKLKDDIKSLKNQVAALAKENDSSQLELRNANLKIGKNDAFAEVAKSWT